jgi:hypothetical protein
MPEPNYHQKRADNGPEQEVNNLAGQKENDGDYSPDYYADYISS